ncbi:DUF742 domain-containing protein [Amycolatopsis sp. lyj-112]|uniref:DUF742 domain-containing protein n=1 Tax=Amycolatopsis sp. lyj-112 TaxID=2789288 RepID=UPI00397BC575
MQDLDLDGDGTDELLIVELCERSVALAEIAAILRIPIGVIRFLVSDLAERGVVHIGHPDDHDDGGGPKFATMERVLEGLRALE